MRKRSVGASLLATVPLILLAATLIFWIITAMTLRASGGLTVAASQEAIRRTVEDIVGSLKDGRAEQADALFNSWVRLAGGSSEAYIALASQITQAGRPADAARYLADATQNNEINWNPRLWHTLAEAQGKANNTSQKALNEAEAERRAEAFLKAGETKAGNGKADKQERIERLDQVAEYYSAVKKEPAKGIALLEEALRLEENAQTLNDLGYNLADKGATDAEFDRAVVLTKKALTLSPNDPTIMDSYGWALFKKNNLAGARRLLRESVDAAPLFSETHYHMGVVYAQLGLTTDAGREFDRALVLDPENKDVLQAKKRLHLPPGQGVLEKA